jgi:hypothetical protein
MNGPPPVPINPAPKRQRKLLIAGILGGVVLLLVLGLYIAIRSVIASGITKGPDTMFGDQHLKTAVALIELHKVRFGKYPDTLKDLKFIGEWDKIALNSVAYYPNPDRTKYYIEVQRGWVGKPNLEMPAEFWLGTGYTPSLKPKTE